MLVFKIILIISLIFLFYSAICIKKKNYIDRLNFNFKLRQEKRKNKEKFNFMDRIDLIRETLDISIASELLILSFLIISGLITYFSFKFFNIKVINLGLFPTIFMLCYLVLKQIHKFKFDSLDKQTIVLVNVMINNLETNDNIVEIFRKSIPFLQGSLRRYCEEFVIETRNIGIHEGFNNLKGKVHSKRLKLLIKNLYISSKHEADFDKILNKSKSIFANYFKLKEKRKGKVRNGRNTIIVLIGLAILVIKMIEGFTNNLVSSLLTTNSGQLIILYFVVLINFTIYQFITIDNFDY